MTRPVVLVSEAAGVVAALLLTVWCAVRGVSTHVFEPVAPGAPSFTSVDYHGAWITAAFASTLVAGLLVLDIRRRRRSAGYPQGVS
ncbi:hypothetical protein DEU38_102146 [Rhodococcus sp. AG1013]|uniref:hypothetical protein n=1 Tax=Rhodococcus sp. AG1013 TaxID=2183996 RepID=UPI000E2ABA0F|nr:hypothetical protein [Rhodococcus sp. AG1013]RDI33791.1 hypothetical protein DEU38_102146 [Rhodococcus sp. AG1013]